ncbi:hypothetical protein BDR03DRAFT_973829 [Suillus americanus]|nr:hypothetical protein BDR03DRAFT_973829 [Suillus americanus]
MMLTTFWRNHVTLDIHITFFQRSSVIHLFNAELTAVVCISILAYDVLFLIRPNSCPTSTISCTLAPQHAINLI